MQHPKLVHPRLTTHPLTGAAIAPVGTRKDGRRIWPILGGAPDHPDPDKKGGGKPDDDKKDEPKGGKADDDKKSDAPPAGGKSEDDDKGAGGKDALKADLARERDKRQELEQSIESMKDGLAKAFGLKPEETSDTDKLNEQLTKLQERLDKADRQDTVLTIATEYGVGKDDIHMLTATDEAGLRKQAEWVKDKNEALETSTKGRRPRPDQSQGGGGGSNNDRTGGGSVAEVMAARRADREKKKPSTTP